MAKKLVIGNWKMNPQTADKAVSLFEGIKITTKLKDVDVVVAPPYIYIDELALGYKGSKIAFGAQDVSFEESGAFTGDISAGMLKDVGVSYVIVGHSERRAGGETNQDVQKKVAAVLAAKMRPVLCIGESERDKDADYLAFLREEIVSALGELSPKELKKVVIAYEPIWAIGKGASAAMDAHSLHQMVVFVRKVLTETFDAKIAKAIPILYGGSVKAENSEELIAEGEIDGFLVGGASLDPENFGGILETVEKA